jgi:hypothetical protein
VVPPDDRRELKGTLTRDERKESQTIGLDVFASNAPSTSRRAVFIYMSAMFSNGGAGDEKRIVGL